MESSTIIFLIVIVVLLLALWQSNNTRAHHKEVAEHWRSRYSDSIHKIYKLEKDKLNILSDLIKLNNKFKEHCDKG